MASQMGVILNMWCTLQYSFLPSSLIFKCPMKAPYPSPPAPPHKKAQRDYKELSTSGCCVCGSQWCLSMEITWQVVYAEGSRNLRLNLWFGSHFQYLIGSHRGMPHVAKGWVTLHLPVGFIIPIRHMIHMHNLCQPMFLYRGPIGGISKCP